jgi:hypothetical protein
MNLRMDEEEFVYLLDVGMVMWYETNQVVGLHFRSCCMRERGVVGHTPVFSLCLLAEITF